MPLIPLKQLSYDDAKDMRRVIDAINANFRYLDWLVNHGNISKENINDEKIVEALYQQMAQALADYQQFIDSLLPKLSSEYIEYGSGDWNASGVEFLLVNGYTMKPVVTASIEGNPADFSEGVMLVIEHIQEQVGNPPQLCYSRIKVIPKAVNLPVPTGAKINLIAVCSGKVSRV